MSNICFLHKPLASLQQQRTSSSISLHRTTDAILVQKFVTKHARRPNPSEATTLGLLTGTRVKAANGKLYPTPTLAEREIAKAQRSARRQYHLLAQQTAQLKNTLDWLTSGVSPRDLAIHMESTQQIETAVDSAIKWLQRFAEELRDGGDLCPK